VQTAYFPHWTIYARCGNSEFPQTVNKYSAEISENMEKFSKSSTIQIGFVTQKVSQGILETQKFTNQKKKAIKANGHRKFKKPKRQREVPQRSRQFCLWINP
jgi:hypothetical protein